MAIYEPKTTMPAHPDLAREQITALQTHGSKQTRLALLSDSQPALTNPLLTCLICIHPYHAANVEGNIETPVMTACGHIFGNKCIKQWLEQDNGGSGKTCPMCRFELKYRECGCVIKAVPAFGTSPSPYLVNSDPSPKKSLTIHTDPTPPPRITASEIPLRCCRCEIRRVVSAEKERYDDLLFELYDDRAALMERISALKELAAHEVDGEETLLTQTQMQETRVQNQEALRLAEKELDGVDKEIEVAQELRDGLEVEKTKKMEELKARSGWFL